MPVRRCDQFTDPMTAKSSKLRFAGCQSRASGYNSSTSVCKRLNLDELHRVDPRRRHYSCYITS